MKPVNSGVHQEGVGHLFGRADGGEIKETSRKMDANLKRRIKRRVENICEQVRKKKISLIRLIAVARVWTIPTV
jgi:hypothetical protein